MYYYVVAGALRGAQLREGHCPSRRAAHGQREITRAFPPEGAATKEIATRTVGCETNRGGATALPPAAGLPPNPVTSPVGGRKGGGGGIQIRAASI